MNCKCHDVLVKDCPAGEQPHAKTFVPSVTTNSSVEPSKPERLLLPHEWQGSSTSQTVDMRGASKPGLSKASADSLNTNSVVGEGVKTTGQRQLGICDRLGRDYFPLHQQPHVLLGNCVNWHPVDSRPAPAQSVWSESERKHLKEL